MEYYLLKEVASYSNLRTSQIEKTSYISTENMLPNKGGITFATSIPNIYSASKYEIGDILLSNIRPYFCKIWLANKEGSCSNDVLVLKANEKVVSKFLYYVLSDKNFFNYDTVTSKGTKMPRGNKNAIMKYLVPKRNVQIQHRIASILSAYDSLIENNTKRIRLLEKMAENLYKEWFVRFRFPGYEKAEMENGLPKGWKVERVFDIADVMYGYAFKSNHFCDNPALNPVVRIRDIQNNHTNTFTDEECEEKYLIKRNAILIGMDGLFHMCLWNGERAFLNQRVVMLNSKKVDFCNYLLFMAIHPQIKYWEQVISGTTVAHLGDKHLKRVQVIVPSTEILSKANSLIARIMGKKNILLRQNTLLARRRDLLLPRLMSGKLEVKP